MSQSPRRKAIRECDRSKQGHLAPKDTGRGVMLCGHCHRIIQPIKPTPKGQELPDLKAFTEIEQPEGEQ